MKESETGFDFCESIVPSFVFENFVPLIKVIVGNIFFDVPLCVDFGSSRRVGCVMMTVYRDIP